MNKCCLNKYILVYKEIQNMYNSTADVYNTARTAEEEVARNTYGIWIWYMVLVYIGTGIPGIPCVIIQQ